MHTHPRSEKKLDPFYQLSMDPHPQEHPCLYSIAGFLPGAKPGSVFAYMHEASSRASHSAGVGASPVCGSACILSAANTRVQGVVLVNSDCRHSPQNANQCFWGAQKHTHALTPRAAIMKMDFWVLEARYEKGKSYVFGYKRFLRSERIPSRAWASHTQKNAVRLGTSLVVVVHVCSGME